MVSERPKANVRERITYGFRLCLARAPKEEESRLLEQVYARALERFQADPAAARAVLGEYRRPSGADKANLAAWFEVATVLLNLDETITKG
jgi:hypothetical protein